MDPWLLTTLLAMNLITFLAFGLDKLRAVRGWRRTPERNLIILAWCAGLVGGWCAMGLFRHKTRKQTFQGMMLLASLFNLAWPALYFGL